MRVFDDILLTLVSGSSKNSLTFPIVEAVKKSRCMLIPAAASLTHMRSNTLTASYELRAAVMTSSLFPEEVVDLESQMLTEED